MKIPKILLIVGGDPTGRDAGTIFLESLCSHYRNDKLVPLFFSRTSTDDLPTKWLGFDVKYLPHPHERFLNIKFPVLNFFNSLIHIPIKRFLIPRLSKKVVHYLKNERIELIWAILNTPSMIYLVRDVIDKTNIPVVCTIWDPPERFSTDFGMDSKTEQRMLNDFEFILKNAKRVGVASEGMQIEYQERYGIKSIRQIHSISESHWIPPTLKMIHDQELIIGFAGNLYASREYRALLSALDSVNWSIEGHTISIWIIGMDRPRTGPENPAIKYCGWKSVDETISLLSKTDITYVPYWFDPKYEITTRLCFPNKISTYLAAGKPILYHGPVRSSPTVFMKRYPVGMCCHSLERADIIDCLRRFIIDPELFESAVIYGQIALREELNQKNFLNRFAELIGVGESYLSKDQSSIKK